ncbi:hypothetical protein C8R41DRAFT_843928 [Lentinula lateritia]|uniref:Uncharacterized protein n=1 Tax=Lentinula lateritia TaxID=40482 RepID=A0ABQ8V881_9AGAR|nr:hypothetical protein C8R41DRAFT_843928 [Lentinula lateritia]
MIPRLNRVKRTLEPTRAVPLLAQVVAGQRPTCSLFSHSYHEPLCARNTCSSVRQMSSSSADSTHINFDSTKGDPGLGLGLRHANPPDTHPNTSHLQYSTPPEHDEHNSKPELEELSDAEWELRTGRTIDILRLTLPTFFNTGLMTSWDPETGDAYPSPTLPSLPSLPHLPNLHLPHLPLPLHISPHPINKDAEKQTIGKRKERHERESIYSSRIRLAYTPPSPLPHPFPEKLTLDGKPLYLTSAVFVRHTLNTLYSDLRVTLVKVAVSVPRGKSSSELDSDSGTTPPLPPNPESDPEPGNSGSVEGFDDPHTKNSGYKREKSLYISLRVTGTSRVSGALGQWEVKSTYTFSPLNAQIIKHTVNGIEPAPERGVWEGLAKVLGLGNIGEGFNGGRQGEGALSGFGGHTRSKAGEGGI